MWTVFKGCLVYVPVVTHKRNALGFGNVPDAVTLMEVSHAGR
jgi:hypothetical protein